MNCRERHSVNTACSCSMSTQGETYTHTIVPIELYTTVCHEINISRVYVLYVLCTGLVKGLLKSSAYAQCLLQTDRHTSEAKGAAISCIEMSHSCIYFCVICMYTFRVYPCLSIQEGMFICTCDVDDPLVLLS